MSPLRIDLIQLIALGIKFDDIGFQFFICLYQIRDVEIFFWIIHFRDIG